VRYQRKLTVLLLPGVTGGDEQDPVEAGEESGFGGVKMGDVNRVEGPAENSSSHEREDRAVAA
jgi:hypothetical protein